MNDQTAPSRRLAELADDAWSGWLRAHPIGSTSLGIRGHDDRLADPSPAAAAERRSELRTLQADLDRVEPGALEAAERVTRDALAAQLAGELAALDAGVHRWAVDPLEGPHVTALNLPALQPADTPAAREAMAARWQGLGPWLDGHTENLRAGVAAGLVSPRSPVRRVIEQVRATLATPDDALALLAPAENEPGSGFRGALLEAVATSFRPALVRYLRALEDEVLPVARPDDRPGLVHVPGGADAYRALVAHHTSLPLEPDDLHRTGLDEIGRIDEELRTLGGRLFGTASLPELLGRLRGDPALHFATRDEVEAAAQAGLAAANAAVPDWFGRLPRTPCEVVRMEAHEEAHSTIAYYRQPATDGSRPGQYFINTSEPGTRPRYEAAVLAYHEAVPGHHLQLAIAQELDHLPPFRRHLGPTVFVEGWGLYTERLSDEMGLYASDLDRIGVLSFDAWRACRLVVDTGMHALGWTRERAIAYMTEHTALGENNIANEVDRYITWPGQALAYKTGQLELLRLRSEAAAALGARFDIRAWHDAVLGEGALGLTAVRGLVRAWIEGRRGDGGGGATPG